MQRIINISNRLPVSIGKNITKSSGGLVSALEGIENQYDLHWIGWPGGVIANNLQREQFDRNLLQDYKYIPIHLSKKEIDDYYNGFANSSLWPLLHYMSTYTNHEKKWYETYKTVNRRFAEKTLEIARNQDIIWIHDYHLMLLPQLLKQENHLLKIGFFLHTPFPSYEVFRCHPNREELLQGVLNANLIGFHTFNYLRHFRSAVLRLLSIESEMNRIVYDNHQTYIDVFPIGIDSGKFKNEIKSESCRKYLREFQENYKNKNVVLSVERLDYTKGIPRRLDAIQLFLSKCRQKDRIVFIFICVPSRGEVPEYQDLINNVEQRVGEINGKYSTIKNVPIHFLHKPVDFSQLCALYALADVALVTPLIDGMNLVAKEYIACQTDKNGVLILSEFAGAAQELFNAFIVNPYDIEQVANTIKKALNLSEKQKIALIEPMKTRVLKYDSSYWARSFLDKLNQQEINPENSAPTRDVDIGAIKPFLKANKIALFLDYDGTLCEIKNKPDDAFPHDDIKEVFALLEKQPNIDTYIISGRKREDMQHWFSRYKFTLIAEHGFYHKSFHASQWKMIDPKADLSWKKQIINIFEHFTGSTPGSSVEEKTSSVVWHYRRSDPEFGAWKANQLVGELYEMLSNLPVEIHHGKKIVEISSTQINKGLAVEHFLQQQHYDAVLCAGDDETDESMFRVNHKELITIKIGEEESLARYKIKTPKVFRDYLKRALQKNLSLENPAHE